MKYGYQCNQSDLWEVGLHLRENHPQCSLPILITDSPSPIHPHHHPLFFSSSSSSPSPSPPAERTEPSVRENQPTTISWISSCQRSRNLVDWIISSSREKLIEDLELSAGKYNECWSWQNMTKTDVWKFQMEMKMMMGIPTLRGSQLLGWHFQRCALSRWPT